MSTSWAVPTIPSPLGALLLLSLAVYASSLAKWRARTRGHSLPPGPRRYPFIGTLFFWHKRDLWEANQILHENYGDVVYVPAFGQSIVVLCGPRAIIDLLEKRSAITSDRATTPLNDLAGQGFNFTSMGYGEWWRRHRRALWQHFTPAATARHAPIQRAFARLFARKLLADPSKLTEHIRYTFAAAIVKIVYGFDVRDTGDPYIAGMESLVRTAEIFTPGKYLVTSLPILRFVPEWVPGAGFQKVFATARRVSDQIREALCARTREGMVSGETSHSVMAELLTRLEDYEDGEEVAKNVALISFEAGADTTFSTLQSFFLAMSLNPDVQKKAQAELDLVVGPDRLPDHGDKPMLPYVNAIVKEALRWQNVLPISLPHRSIEDVVYDGHFIPAGTFLMPHTWGCLHDPTAYPEPDQFLPDRFMRAGEPDLDIRDPMKFAFGYGRRGCPGKHFAESSLFINIAIVLHTFQITAPLDGNGKPIKVEPRMTNGIMSYPQDCRCTLKLRSERAKALIMDD